MKALKHFTLLLLLTVVAAGGPESKTAGVGVALGVEGRWIVVKAILPDSPAAAHKSLGVGDRIVAVAQENEAPVQIQHGNLAQAVTLLRGTPGTTVRLTIVVAGQDQSRARVVSFVRGELKALTRWGDGALLPDRAKAPDIEMIRIPDGEAERLSKYAGKTVVLEFWATWCGPCQTKMSELQGYFAQYPEWKDRVVLLAASVDDSADIAARHLKAKGWDQSHNVWVATNAIKAYHIEAIPTAYVISREGTTVTANPESIPDVVNGELARGGAFEAK